MKKIIVLKPCMTKEGVYLEAGKTCDLDPKADKKLWGLNLVEDYDEKKHGEVKNDPSIQLKEANKTISELQSKLDNAGDTEALTVQVAELQGKLDNADAKITNLHGFVKEAIGSNKNTVPTGYEEAK